MCVCVCVCVIEREKERKTETAIKKEKHSGRQIVQKRENKLEKLQSKYKKKIKREDVDGPWTHLPIEIPAPLTQ